VLIKASAGGGGKGMRAVEKAEDFADALASCQREAKSSFGDDHVLIEKYLQRPRHIEIQVFGDTPRQLRLPVRARLLGAAPPPEGARRGAGARHDAERRAAMGKAAVDAAKAVGYVGAGTVEFIVNQDGTFYFMEMNTRLQVEHPVTEMITGLDLVEWQLKVAAGEPLPLAQEQLRIHGHALEARIYAEDPDKGFLPSIGKLIHLAPPAETINVRVDTGVEQDDEISPHYDPMIAKLIVWDESRERALARMLQALADYRVVGVSNNIGFLSRLVACPAFAQADLDTGLIERERGFLFPEGGEPPVEAWLVAALAELIHDRQYAAAEAIAGNDPHSPWHARDGWRVNSTRSAKSACAPARPKRSSMRPMPVPASSLNSTATALARPGILSTAASCVSISADAASVPPWSRPTKSAMSSSTASATSSPPSIPCSTPAVAAARRVDSPRRCRAR
jgi:3-methylcrotonyl-CoA carboxylase alpha subunit